MLIKFVSIIGSKLSSMYKNKTVKTFSVFADESGDLKDANNEAASFALVMASSSKLDELNKQFDELKAEVATMGIDTSDPKFEFHASDLFNRKEYWRKLSEEQIIYIGKSIRHIILKLKLPYVIVLTDKRQHGIENMERICKDINEFQNQYKVHFASFRAFLEHIIPEKLKKKGMEKETVLIGLLFGLASGLLGELSYSNSDYKGKCHIIVDNQFIKQHEHMQYILQRLKSPWIKEIANKVAYFWDWNFNETAEWRLGSDIEPIDSCSSYGVQAADFVAYTTRYQWEHMGVGTGLAAGIAITSLVKKKQSHVNFPNYGGIYVFIPRWAIGTHVMKDKNNRFWKRILYTRNQR